MSGLWLPLFPLQVVLFPGMSLPLHIFEPRYRLMIRTCLERKEEFGVVLARRKGMAQIGCTAKILHISREFPDGRFDILTLGRRRFRIGALSDELPYLQAEVDFFAEGTGPEPAPTQINQLVQLWPEAYRLATGETHTPEQPPEFGSLSYFIAATLPFELETRQEVLEAEPEALRLRLLTERLSTWLPRLRRLAHVKERAAGNGRG